MKRFEDGDPFFAPMLNALFAAFRGTAVMSGCEVSATGTSRTVSITAGSVQINGEVIAVGAGSVTLDAGSTFDRYDLVSVNASGSKIVTKGTTKRKCPTQPANTCLLAIVFVPAGATVIATGNVYDARMDATRLSVLNLQAVAIYPRVCAASDTVRREVGSRTWSAYGGSFTGMEVLLSTMIPPAPYYMVNAGKTMSVRVKFVHSTSRYQSNPTTTKSAILVDGVKVWESGAVPYGSPLTVSQDVNVDGGSLIEVACTSIAGGIGTADGIQITDLQICCTDSFVAPPGW